MSKDACQDCHGTGVLIKDTIRLLCPCPIGQSLRKQESEFMSRMAEEAVRQSKRKKDAKNV